MTFSDLDNSGKIEASETLGSDEILQENHYYPFGMQMDGPWQQIVVEPENHYLYNGKELNEDFGLDWLDYGARWYDPAIGRWNAVDPLAEVPENISWSPYVYVWNRPLVAIDPDGRNGIITVDKENKTVLVESTIHYSRSDFKKGTNYSGNHSDAAEFVNGILATANEYLSDSNVEVDGENYDVSFSITFKGHDTDQERDAATLGGDDKLVFETVGGNGSYSTPSKKGATWGGTFHIPKSNNSIESALGAHEIGHSFGLTHDDGIITKNPGPVDVDGGKYGDEGSLMTYASKRNLFASEVQKIIQPSVRKANKKRKNVQSFRVYGNGLTPKKTKRRKN